MSNSIKLPSIHCSEPTYEHCALYGKLIFDMTRSAFLQGEQGKCFFCRNNNNLMNVVGTANVLADSFRCLRAPIISAPETHERKMSKLPKRTPEINYVAQFISVKANLTIMYTVDAAKAHVAQFTKNRQRSTSNECVSLRTSGWKSNANISKFPFGQRKKVE